MLPRDLTGTRRREGSQQERASPLSSSSPLASLLEDLAKVPASKAKCDLLSSSHVSQRRIEKGGLELRDNNFITSPVTQLHALDLQKSGMNVFLLIVS